MDLIISKTLFFAYFVSLLSDKSLCLGYTVIHPNNASMSHLRKSSNETPPEPTTKDFLG